MGGRKGQGAWGQPPREKAAGFSNRSLDMQRQEKAITSISARNFFISFKHTSVRPPDLIASSTPLSHSRSLPSLDPLTITLAEVSDLRSSCDRVTDRDELVGRIRVVSRLPQLVERNKVSARTSYSQIRVTPHYFTAAMLTCTLWLVSHLL